MDSLPARSAEKRVKKDGRLMAVPVKKFASAHDLRWSFGTRWAKRVMPALLRRLMRHAEIAATMKYYVTMDADSVADELWGRDWETDNSLRAGNTLGNNCPTTPRNAERAADAATSEPPNGNHIMPAEGTGLEPATPFGAPHFQCGR